jgi:AraC-like DNA-binding protein
MSEPARKIKLLHHATSDQVKLYPCYIHAMGWWQYSFESRNRRSKGEWSDHQIQLVIRGKGYLHWNGKIYTLTGGDAFFIDLSEPSFYYADKEDPWEAMWIHFGGNQADFYYRLFGKSSPVVKLSRPDSAKAHFLRLFELLEHTAIGSDLHAASQLIQLMTGVVIDKLKMGNMEFSKQPGQHEKISKVMQYIDQHYERALSMKEIASVVSVSPYYLSRLFSAMTGYTVKEYMIKQRIKKAKDFLANSDATLSDIAGMCGFSDQSHMGKMFRQYEKTTPKKYRTLYYGR